MTRKETPEEGAARKKAAFRKRYLRWKRDGRCVWCGSKKTYTKYHCRKHRDKFNEHMRNSDAHKRSVADRKRRLKEAGLCIVCMEPSVNAQHCEEHRIAHNEYLRERRARGLRG